MAKIGIYGGSFNPIHLGHFNLAIELMEKCSLDEIWLVPAQLNPFKQVLPVSSEHRLAMIHHAIAGVEGFVVCDLELKRPAPSYTIDTLEELIRSHRDQHQFYLLMGEDAARTFAHWHRAEDIIRLVPLLIGCRSDSSGVQISSIEPPMLAEALQQGRVITKIFDISSTEVRQRLVEGKFCGHLLREKVLDYILHHRLYC